ncbi:hypothetical protein KU6B_48050 [Mameliella alba]|uniref:hypothetical protein n=1 Tax=Mameliella alba TaxID=561184 RepID=UPI0013E450FB|nr:hypothetical protein [Mameliella alba]BBU58540.1 hypothetical protein KU6B_48050 [Mameliella alba]
MTALEITRALKANRRAMLWISEDWREASFYDGEYGHKVCPKAARIARSDPAFSIIDTRGGETLAAI